MSAGGAIDVMPYNTYAYFFVRGFDCPIQQISDLLQIAPSEAWLKNQEGMGGRPRKFSNWELHSPLLRTEPFQDRHLDALLAILEDRRERVLQAISLYSCGLQGVGIYTNEHPGFHMDAELVSRIAAFGLSVDFDLYCRCDHERPEAQPRAAAKTT